ncbi:siderophore-interacting protein, partial [Cutibacterium acnes]
MAEYRPYLMRLSSRSLVEPNFIRPILTGDEVQFPQPCLDRRLNLPFPGEHPNP